MFIPDHVRCLAQDEAFWRRYFWQWPHRWYQTGYDFDERAIARLEAEDGPPRANHAWPGVVHVPLGDIHALKLEESRDLGMLSLSLQCWGEERLIAQDSHHHWTPHVLQWDELELICRLAALDDITLSHPGLPLLLLARFAVIDSDTQADVAFPMLDAAWNHVGFPHLAVRTRAFDLRQAGVEWRLRNRYDPHGAFLYQSEAAFETAFEAAFIQVASQRTEHGDFPFRDWSEAMEAGERVYRWYKLERAEWLVRNGGRAGALAAQLLDDGDFGFAAAVLADALEEADCRNVSILAALRSGVAAQTAWALEWLLNRPIGSIIQSHFGPTSVVRETVSRFDIRVPEPVERTRAGLRTLGDELAERLDDVLARLHLGQARSHTMPLNLFHGDEQVGVVKVSHSCPFAEVRKLLRDLLTQHPLPPESVLEICDPHRRSIPVGGDAGKRL